ncbi:MAG: YadA-like family protein [Sutterella sp.]|nr:YadA-like family protein [Sutterella sp.]
MAALLPFTTSLAAEKDIEYKGGSVSYNGSNPGANIAVGNQAYVLVGNGTQDKLMLWGTNNFNYLPEGMAIGTNASARSGSIAIGARLLSGFAMGDVTDAHTVGALGVANTVVGNNSYVNGPFATTFGSYNIQSSPYKANGGLDTIFNGPRNSFATVIGTFNSNESMSGSSDSGVGNFIGGVANKVSKSNGSLVLGGGNTVTNSYSSLSSVASLAIGTYNSPKAFQDALNQGLRSASGGSALILGSGNTMDYARYSQVLGIQNSIIGTSLNRSEYNAISGTGNTLTNSSRIYVSGNSNEVSGTKNGILIGDNRIFSSANGSIAIGFSTGKKTSSTDTRTRTTVADAVMIGTDSQVDATGGVAIGLNARVGAVAQEGDLAGIALGAKSVSTILAGVEGYDPTTSAASTDSSYVWKSTAGALSLGDVASDTKVTRQITGVAAGLEDTDAVNVAQLKAAISHLTPAPVDPDATEYAPATTISANSGSETNINGSDPKNLVVVESTNSLQGKHYDIRLANKLQLGSNTANNQVTIDGDLSQVTIGSGSNALHFDGNTGEVGLGKVQVNGSEGTVGGLTNTTWDGTNYTSGQAATEDQLYQATRAQDDRYRQLQRDINELDDDIRDAGAASAALAGLKPIQYDPLQPTQFMAAVGGYRGSYALSMGVAHYTSERFMLHAGVAMNKYPMFNVGFTFKFGGKSFKLNDQEYRAAADRYQAGPITASYVMQKELADDQQAQTQGLLTKVQSLETQNAELVSKNAALENKVTELAKAMDELKALIKASRR